MRNLFIKLKTGLITALNQLLIVAVLVLVLDVVWGVFTRYVLGNQAQWTEELARFMLIWISLLGGAVAFGLKGHLGVDFLVEKFHPDAKKMTAMAVHATVLIFSVVIFIYGGSRVVADALTMEQTTPAMGWKMGYVYLALPVSGLFMLLFSIENLIQTIITSSASTEATSIGGLD
ncbi:MAG: TRAP transporter small permease [Kiritimatiellaceae bacterium]|nr:TRAP transporter small permease [Kiritimatiellaceae bacterium]